MDAPGGREPGESDEQADEEARAETEGDALAGFRASYGGLRGRAANLGWRLTFRSVLRNLYFQCSAYLRGQTPEVSSPFRRG